MAERPSITLRSSAPSWTELNDLSSSSLGGEVVFSTDDWFAAAEMLLSDEEPQWREGFTEQVRRWRALYILMMIIMMMMMKLQGKWMYGWETRRKRIPGHDWSIIKLGLPGKISGIELDTSFFTGNYAPRASVQAIWSVWSTDNEQS